MVIIVEKSGESGNIFMVMGNAKRELENLGRKEEAKEMLSKVKQAKSYEEALEIIGEHVELDIRD